MTDTKINEFHQRYSETIAAELRRVRPGEIVAPDVEAAAQALFEAGSGLQRNEYLSNPYGYPMMPIPLGGKQRLPKNVTHALMGHPVFWLDEKVADRQEGETDEHWAVRLYMELLVRGWWDPQSGEWFDVLQVAGFDLSNPAFRRRIEAYRDGAPDTDLAMLVIERFVEGLDDVNGPSGYADEVVATLEPVLHELSRFAAAEVERESAEARRYLRSEFMSMARPLVTALDAYRTGAAAGQWQEPWRAASAAAYELRDEIDEVFRSVIDASGPLLRASAEDTDDYLNGVYALCAQVQTAETERHAQFDSLMMTLRDRGTDDAAFKALFDALREAHAAAVAQLREVYGRVDQIDASGDWHPPEESMSAEDETAIVMPGEERALPGLRTVVDGPGRPAPAPRGRGRSAAEMFDGTDLPGEK